MTFTATIPPNALLPEETWLTARVRRHGTALEVTADAGPPALAGDKSAALHAWLARCAAQPVNTLSDAALDDLRWQRLKEKHQL